jgi:hypothetical protein
MTTNVAKEEERRPLLDNCCSEREGCCRYNKKQDTQPNTTTSLFISTNELDNDPTCQLSNQPWKYKIVALLCAMFLAGKV